MAEKAGRGNYGSFFDPALLGRCYSAVSSIFAIPADCFTYSGYAAAFKKSRFIRFSRPIFSLSRLTIPDRRKKYPLKNGKIFLPGVKISGIRDYNKIKRGPS